MIASSLLTPTNQNVRDARDAGMITDHSSGGMICLFTALIVTTTQLEFGVWTLFLSDYTRPLWLGFPLALAYKDFGSRYPRRSSKY